MAPVKYIVVPADAFSRPCQACGKTCFFVKTASAKYQIVDCAADENCKVPQSGQTGIGVAHWGTCTDPNRFSKKKRAS